LGNSVDHVGLRVKITTEPTITPPSSVDQVVSELIMPTQMMAKKMVMVSEGEDLDEELSSP
jgi:hypothetical protein